jgi:hypothetical protein
VPEVRARRVYRWLLRAYPPAFRAAYGRDLEQLFADVWRAQSGRGVGQIRIWWWAIRDTLARAPVERIQQMRHNRWWLMLVIVAAVAGLLIGLVDTSPHWDDTGITVAALVAVTGTLGLVYPRGAWVWALTVGIWIPLLNIVQTHNASSVLALAFAFAGAYAGAAGRRIVASVV